MALLAPVAGARADELAAACPGLFTVEGAGPQRHAVADDARSHPEQLEKVTLGLLAGGALEDPALHRPTPPWAAAASPNAHNLVLKTADCRHPVA